MLTRSSDKTFNRMRYAGIIYKEITIHTYVQGDNYIVYKETLLEKTLSDLI